MQIEEHIQLLDLSKDLEEKLKTASENNRLNEPAYIDALKDIFPEHEKQINLIAEDAEQEQGTKLQYFMEGVDKDNKSEVAAKYADYLVKKGNIKPVVIDGATIFYQYDPETKIWQETNLEKLRKKMNRDLTEKPFNITVTSHMRNEFNSNMKNHHEYADFEQFGLEENKILLKNGEIIDLSSNPGELEKESRPCEKHDYALNGVNAELRPELMRTLESNRLEEFIVDTIPDDDQRRALQQFLGYCLSWPSDQYQSSLLILGPTDSGKSTLLKVFREFFSLSNVTSISFPQLGYKRAFHIARLKNSILNIDHDMADSSIDSMHRIKKLTAKEEVNAEPKGEASYDMKPNANYMMASNHAPSFDNDDEAFLNRFLTIEAPNQVSEDDKDRNLLNKLTSDKCLNWLLLWAIEGLEDLKTEGKFAVNRDARETKRFWSYYGDSAHRFINQNVERGTEDSGNIPTQDLYDVYESWCEENFLDPLSARKFVQSVQEHPLMTKRAAFARSDLGGSRRQCFIDIEVDAPL